jgi:hypothetical protein
MNFQPTSDINSLAASIPAFISLVGDDRWHRRIEHLDKERRKSFFLWRIVADYHWLEMAISHQAAILQQKGHLLVASMDNKALAALDFAASLVQAHAGLSAGGKRVLEGRLRDCLKAEAGFAPISLEMDFAARLMAADYNVRFADMEGSGQFDLEITNGSFLGEVECKSISADAGRRIHRKDFYRFMDAIASGIPSHAESEGAFVIVVTLRDRLLSDEKSQRELRGAVTIVLSKSGPPTVIDRNFRVERRQYPECLNGVPCDNRRRLYGACVSAFGAGCHVAGGLNRRGGGCLVVMRSEAEDDTSRPLLDAMRKAASQFSRTRPSFIAVQFQEIEPADLILPHFRRRIGILTHALFDHYGAQHVNAAYFCGFGAVVARDGRFGTPTFAITNPQPFFVISSADAAPFWAQMPDADFAAIIDAPRPGSKMSDPGVR